MQMLGKGAEVTGYARIADNAIFISRPEKKDHIRSTLDPRFAPQREAVIITEEARLMRELSIHYHSTPPCLEGSIILPLSISTQVMAGASNDS
jgi:hypothetical protein